MSSDEFVLIKDYRSVTFLHNGVTRTISAGDAVSWTHVGESKRTLSMSVRNGTVEAIDGLSLSATIKKKRGRETIALVRLRVKGEKSQIFEFVEAIRGKEHDQKK